MSVTKPKRSLSAIGIIVSMVLVLGGLFASIGGFTNAIAESGYQSVTGTIQGVDLKKNSTRKNRTKNRCAPIVDFQVAGKTYRSGPDHYSTYGKNDECKYSAGDEITVHYDPSDPTKSTVSGSTFDWFIGLLGAAVAVTFGLIIPVRIIRRNRTEARVDS
jgi:hypothetical protein